MSTVESLLASPDQLEALVATVGDVGSTPRFVDLLERMQNDYDGGSGRDVWLASAPGRTELAGNHTDHNRGRVLAASVTLDSIAAVTARDDGTIRIASEGFSVVELSMEELSPRNSERESTGALVRGVLAGFACNGHRVGGFDAVVSSTVHPGSGLSSSASFEVLVGTILDALYNDRAVGPTRIARIGKFAENTFFGKPSGLMDQLACATGGAVAIDFEGPDEPRIDRVDVSFEEAGLALLVVDTGASHADLTSEYAAIPADMRAVAAELGGEVLRDVDRAEFYANLSRLRSHVGDRAVSRAMHFYDENSRVEVMVESLKRGDYAEYLRVMADSGRSSGLFLQNCVPVSHPERQGVVIALALTEHYVLANRLKSGIDAAGRVHGGGFAGTIQVLLPAEHVEPYRSFIARHLADDAVTRIGIRNSGAVCGAR